MAFIELPNGDVCPFESMRARGNSLIFNGIYTLDYHIAEIKENARKSFVYDLNRGKDLVITVPDPVIVGKLYKL